MDIYSPTLWCFVKPRLVERPSFVLFRQEMFFLFKWIRHDYCFHFTQEKNTRNISRLPGDFDTAQTSPRDLNEVGTLNGLTKWNFEQDAVTLHLTRLRSVLNELLQSKAQAYDNSASLELPMVEQGIGYFAGSRHSSKCKLPTVPFYSMDAGQGHAVYSPRPIMYFWWAPGRLFMWNEVRVSRTHKELIVAMSNLTFNHAVWKRCASHWHTAKRNAPRSPLRSSWPTQWPLGLSHGWIIFVVAHASHHRAAHASGKKHSYHRALTGALGTKRKSLRALSQWDGTGGSLFCKLICRLKEK